MKVLVINCGSSSVKYKVFEMPGEKLLTKGSIEKIGEEISFVKHQVNDRTFHDELKVQNHEKALGILSQYLVDEEKGIIKNVEEIEGIGHRVVHGGEGFNKSVVINEKVLERIEEYKELAPLHNPPNLAGIKATSKFFPKSVQVAAFDTAFHTTIPEVAYLYALPYELYEKYRIRRYGFHGTSHRYVARRAASLLKKGKYEVNIITVHLGNGCSMTAVQNGHSIDTSMGLTPLEGLIMGTRSGDIDPGILFYLEDRLGIDSKRVNALLNKESGLLGISGISNDFRNLLAEYEKGNKKSILAIDMFCYRIKKYIGAYMAVLQKVDAVVFTGGIGENVPLVREKSLENMQNLGIIIDKKKNTEKGIVREREISSSDSKIKVFVIPTDEELGIAFDTCHLTAKKRANG